MQIYMYVYSLLHSKHCTGTIIASNAVYKNRCLLTVHIGAINAFGPSQFYYRVLIVMGKSS